ncbi:MAG: hypothetical protein KZQ99_07435 [Candidatus Thiodiazotropha sp. (ex Dulcina madagascariensis)]|nr:hypothetical protein [Candidatus Thiodiazotropha sp. (ex Dulcina madagascariensis)]
MSVGALGKRFPKLGEWLSGESSPTLKQLESFARATHTAVGYLFLPEPPQVTLPVSDFRTMPHARMDHPSPDLLDTIYLCQQRQAWYRDYLRLHGEAPLGFVGAAAVDADVAAQAARMRHALGFDLAQRQKLSNWTEALRGFIAQVEGSGVLVMVSGIVGSNTRRKLDPEEFRGFCAGL